MEKIDYKKTDKALYRPKAEPEIIEVPEMQFIQIDGCGNPNLPDGEYQKAVEILYSLAYTIKMMPKNGIVPRNYVEYVVPPLEGLWWLQDKEEFDFGQKSKFCWTSMIRQPDFVTEEIFASALEMANAKKPHLNFSKARLSTFTEGLCVQCMHLGSFDDEPETLKRMEYFIQENDLISDLSEKRRHHEIYLNDPRKVDVSKMKTILRYPVRRA